VRGTTAIARLSFDVRRGGGGSGVVSSWGSVRKEAVRWRPDLRAAFAGGRTENEDVRLRTAASKSAKYCECGCEAGIGDEMAMVGSSVVGSGKADAVAGEI
jgi:hypothetical protein